MPSLSVDRQIFADSIGKQLTDKEIDDITFDFGVELDEIYTENGRKMLKFDIPANRYDLLCLEGFSTAIRTYLGNSNLSTLNIIENPTISVKKFQTHERNHIACAIIKGINFDQSSYDSFISYQDKLHSSIGRNRSLVAIGTHDLSKINGEITYQSVDLIDTNFTPLNSTSMINGGDLENFYSKDKKISKFFSLLTDQKRAVAFKCGDDIMSIPPIINSDATKISMDTKDIFVEVTGTDFNKINTALKYILYNFRGESVEKVKIISSEDDTLATPVFHEYRYILDLNTINRKLHLDLDSTQIKQLLERMMHSVTVDGSDILVNVPDSRMDVLHECDLMEDIAIAYGFNNFEMRIPPILTVGRETPLNKFTDKLRLEMALAGYNEVLTLTLLSKSENNLTGENDRAVVLANPKSKEYEVVRTSLLPGILKSISSNLHGKIPIKVFEIADVVLKDSNSDEGARNERRACAVIASNKSLLEDVQGPLSLLFEKCGIKNYEYISHGDDDEIYLKNQSASVNINGKNIGSIGVLHPSICHKFEIPYAASSFEIDVEELLKNFKGDDSSIEL